MCRTQCAERRWDVGDRLGVRRESIGPETLPGLLALPDPDDPEPLVGRARGVQQEPIRGRARPEPRRRGGTAPSWRRRPRRSRTTCPEPRTRRCRTGIARTFRRSDARSHWWRARDGSACARPGRARRRRRAGRAHRDAAATPRRARDRRHRRRAPWTSSSTSSGATRRRRPAASSSRCTSRSCARRSPIPSRSGPVPGVRAPPAHGAARRRALRAPRAGRHGCAIRGQSPTRRIASRPGARAVAWPPVRGARLRRVRARRGRAVGGATARCARRAARTHSWRSASMRRCSATSWVLRTTTRSASARRSRRCSRSTAADVSPRRSSTTRSLRRRLLDELGLDPSRALRELQQRILRQDPALDAPPGGGDQRSGSARARQPARRSRGRARRAPSDPAPQRRSPARPDRSRREREDAAGARGCACGRRVVRERHRRRRAGAARRSRARRPDDHPGARDRRRARRRRADDARGGAPARELLLVVDNAEHLQRRDSRLRRAAVARPAPDDARHQPHRAAPVGRARLPRAAARDGRRAGALPSSARRRCNRASS